MTLNSRIKQSMGLMALVLFLFLALPVSAAPLCAQTHLQDSVGKKIVATGTAPVREMWTRITYTEVPSFQSHPIYQKVESKLSPAQAVAVNKLLYVSANGFRKIYNALAERGLGLPLPAIKTQRDKQELPDTFKKTYWGDLNGWLGQFSLLQRLKTGTTKAYKAMVLTGTIFFSLHTMGNVAGINQSKSVYLLPEQSVSVTMPLKDHQIQILNETAPFPHTAIRIGDMVFSHGVDTLTQKQVDLYMNLHRLNQQGSFNGLSSAEAANTQILKNMGEVKRSVDAITLNLDRETVLKIRDQLLSQTNKPYKNTTFVNSCSSMVARVLESQGVNISGMFLDASPSLMFSQLSLESLAGRQNKRQQPLIEGIYDIHYQGDSHNTFRNFMIRQLEGGVQLQIHTLPIRLAQRIHLNMENKNVNDFYMELPGLKEGLEKIREQAEADMHMIQDYDLYMLEKQALADSKAGVSERTALNKKYEPVFSRYIADYQAAMKDPSISFSEYHTAQFKIEFLRAALTE